MSSVNFEGQILIIDPDVTVTLPLTEYFGQRGYEVLTVEDGAAGVRQAFAHRPDIVLLAPQLRDGEDGLTVFKRLRGGALTAHIPVMVLLSRLEAMRQREFLQAGVDDVIQKPFDVEILALRMRNAMHRARQEGATEPRTGLPSGKRIDEKIAAIENDHDWCRMDIHLEHFDAFRQRHNFISANEVLRYVANEICEAIAEDDIDDDFVGHMSEAHFVVVTKAVRGATLRQELAHRLAEGVRQFHDFMERDQGYVLVEDKYGDTVQRPLMRVDVRFESGHRGEHDHAPPDEPGA